MKNQKSPEIFHSSPASFGDRIICLRLQVHMNYYCGPISAGNLWVNLDKWEVAVVRQESIMLFWFRGIYLR